jgi:hypothetical protein
MRGGYLFKKPISFLTAKRELQNPEILLPQTTKQMKKK